MCSGETLFLENVAVSMCTRQEEQRLYHKHGTQVFHNEFAYDRL